VNFYDNAAEVHKAAEVLYNNAQYRMSVSNSCLAMELYLKSKLHLTDKGENYAYSHDTINMYIQLANRFKPDENLLQLVKIGKKYFNESRYPHGDKAIYTKAFAKEFLDYVEAIKSYIDDVCVGNIDDLQNRFRK
jgi:HEPN domain-containing protein